MLAEAAVLGVPVDRLLNTTDPMEKGLLEKMVKEAAEVLDEIHTNLARKIVNEYAKARERGKKKEKKGKG